MDVEDVLEHYGVKGMRWGVRRSDAQLAKARKERESSKSSDAERAEKSISKAKSGRGSKSLSNQELTELTKRLELERKYNQLTKETSTLNRGLNATKKVLAVGTTVNGVIAFARSPAGQAIRGAVTKV